MTAEQNSWFLIVNPETDNGRALLDFPRISQLLHDGGIHCEPHFTEYRHHAVELTVQAIKKGWRRFIIIGGDGVLHEAVNGFFIQQIVPREELTLAVIAVGSGNNWSLNFGFKEGDYNAMVQAIIDGRTILQDVGIVDYEEAKYRQARYMICAAGTGFDSYVVQRFSRRLLKGKRRGKLSYLWCVVKSFFRYRSKSVRIYADGRLVYNNQLFSAAVGIGRYKVGGLQQLPSALPDDGFLDMTIFRPLRFWHILFRFLYLYNGNLYRIGHTKHLRAKQFRIVSESEMLVEIDGELWGGTPLEFSVLKRAVQVVVCKDYNERKIEI